MALMTERRVRHLPVLDGKKVIGIVSIGDLVKSIIGELKFVIDQLHHYIRGSLAFLANSTAIVLDLVNTRTGY